MGKKKKSKAKKARNQIETSARKVWLAGLGALSIAEKEGAKAFRKLVEAGEDMEERGRPVVEEMKGQAVQTWAKVEETVDSSVNSALQSMGVPTRAEVEELQKRVAELQAELEKSKADAAADSAPAKKTTRKRATRKATSKQTTAKKSGTKRTRKKATKKAAGKKTTRKKTTKKAARKPVKKSAKKATRKKTTKRATKSPESSS